jgi:hypothetical protein
MVNLNLVQKLYSIRKVETGTSTPKNELMKKMIRSAKLGGYHIAKRAYTANVGP